MSKPSPRPSLDFVRQIVADDLDQGKNEGRVHTRFPPEPNGYLHVGHAKAICMDFGIAAENPGGLCNLRFDDTNPVAEDVEYVEAIEADVRWLGFDWGDRKFFASDYFQALYDHAVTLVKKGLAYVDNLTPEETREYRGTLTEPGKNSPWRDRSVEENLDLFERMRKGEFEEGSCVLRAKIDMASPNMNLRDPAIYRIRKAHHHRTGDTWCIYPMYDYAHCVSDSIEGITHSLCTLEFEHHRPLYDWFLEKLEIHHPQQIEFARMNLSHAITSKRKIKPLIENDVVDGWDDPRLVTLRGMRRRGYTPEAIREFCVKIGVSKFNSTSEMALLESCLRDDLNRRAHRAMAVLRPLKVTITNWPEGHVEHIEAPRNPEDPDAGTRTVPLSGTVWIERDDFREDAPRKFFRLAPDREVRLRYGYAIRCNEVIKDESGDVIELRCTYDPETAKGQTPDGRKIKGILHWVSDAHALDAQVRLYDALFTEENPAASEDILEILNPGSLEILEGCKLEPSLAEARVGEPYQFERVGYFVVDSKHSTPEAPVFNRTVGLRDSWAKIEKKQGGGGQKGQGKSPKQGGTQKAKS